MPRHRGHLNPCCLLEPLANFNSQGTTIFPVEQNANLALEVAHRGYVLEVGRMVLSGSGSELLNTPIVQESHLGGSDYEDLLRKVDLLSDVECSMPRRHHCGRVFRYLLRYARESFPIFIGNARTSFFQYLPGYPGGSRECFLAVLG